MEERQQIYAQNREKRKEFEKVLFSCFAVCIFVQTVYCSTLEAFARAFLLYI